VLWTGWLTLVALFVFCWQMMTKDTIWSFVWDAPRQAADIGDRMIPPAFGYFRELIKPLWDTLNIATLGTIIAILIAVPVAFLAARNTTPSTGIVRPFALLLIVASRSINSLIWGLLLVTIIGPGVFAGISVFRWDINIRESTVLGLVGAGGLGLKLQASVNTLAWNQVTTILLVILATVAISEWISALVRHAVI
jgi:phosphonate transport system permease protein